MTRKAKEAQKWATAKSDSRRQVFAKTCECRTPQRQNAVHFGTFCLGCFHPIAPKVQKRGR